MKTIALLLPVALLATGLVACPLHADDNSVPATSAPAATDNTLSNGNLSAVTGTPKWPVDWPQGKGLSFETEDGVSFLRLTSGAGDMIMLYRDMAIPANAKNLLVTIRYRSKGIQKGEKNWFDARAIFHFLGADGKPMPGDPAPIRFADDQPNWTDVSTICKAQDGAQKFVIMPCLFKTQAGTLDIASVSVVPQS
jgi:hypothetical protein